MKNITLKLLVREGPPFQIVPFDSCLADLLHLAGADDHNCPSAYYAQQGAKRMEAAGKSNFEVLVFPGMGHLCQLPYSPGTFDALHPLVPGVRLYMGGDANKPAHFRGQEMAWKKTLDFLKESLRLNRA